MRLYPVFWGVGLNLLPLFIRIDIAVPNFGRFQKDCFFLTLVMLSLLFFGFRVEKGMRWLVGIFGYFIAFSFLNQHNLNSVTVFYQFVCLSAGLLLIAQMVSNLKREDMGVILNSLSIACLVQCLAVMMNVMGCDIVDIILKVMYGNVQKFTVAGQLVTASEPVRILGTLGNPNVTGAFIALTSITLFRNRWAYCLPVVLCGLFYLGSSMPILTFLVASLAFGITATPKRFRAFALMAIPAAMFLVFALVPISDIVDGNGRFNVWGQAVTWLSGASIVFGKGLAYFSDMFSRYHPGPVYFHSAHNEYIDAYIAFGVVGLSLVGKLLHMIKNVYRNPLLFSMVIGLLVNCVGNFCLHTSSTALIAIIIYSLAFINSKGEENGFNIHKR